MEKTRNQIEEKYKWDLQSIYSSVEEFNNQLTEVKQTIKELKKYDQIMMSSADNLYKTLTHYFEVSRKLSKLWTYASNKYNEDISNSSNQILMENVSTLFDKFNENTSYFTPNLLKYNYSKIQEFFKENPNLKEYEFILEKEYRNQKHILSEKEESLISKLSKAFGDAEEIGSMLRDADMTFENIKDEEGKEVTLTESNYTVYITSKDRKVRKEAFKNLYKGYKKYNNTLSVILKQHLEAQSTAAKIRKYNSSLEASLFKDNISTKVYNNLIDTVSAHLDYLYDYYDFKKQVLNLDEMHLYDTYVNVAQTNNKKYTFEEGKKLVLDTLKILGEDYLQIAKKSFTENWYDIYPNKGKRGGAYSSGSYDTKPFILLNYTEKYHDVSTIIHELGHSIHTYYSNKNNPYQYSNYTLFVAEVASQVNELLLADNMLSKAKTKNEKLAILNELLDLFKGSIFRQTMFAEFDKIVSQKTDNEEILTSDELNNIYYKLNQKYFGKNIIIDDEIKYEWERIPHFFYDFYVYKYSVGLAAACHIVKQIKENKNNAIERYLNFLKSGGSDYPLNELKIAGVDLEDRQVIESALEMFKHYLDEFKNLYSKE